MTNETNNTDNSKASDHVQKGDRKGDLQDSAEIKGRNEAGKELNEGSLNEKALEARQKQFKDGKSYITDKKFKGMTGQKFASAKDLLGDNAYRPLSAELSEKRNQEFRVKGWDPDAAQGKPVNPSGDGRLVDYKPIEHSKSSFSLGVAYETGPQIDSRTPQQKFQDFAVAAAKRATDPEGWKNWAQEESEKFHGIWEGLVEAKDETKAVVAAGFKALTDGTVSQILSHPESVTLPACNAVRGALDAMSKDPELALKVMGQIGNEVIQASENYSKMSGHEKGIVIGKSMFFMINPEGSTEGADAALKIADKVATKVDKVVMETIEQSLKTAQKYSSTLPETAQQTKQMLYEYLQQKGLTGAEMEYAGVPKGYFDGIKPLNENPNILQMQGRISEGAIQSIGKKLETSIPSASERLAGLAKSEDFPDRVTSINRILEMSQRHPEFGLDAEIGLNATRVEHLKQYEEAAQNLAFLSSEAPKDFTGKDVAKFKDIIKDAMDDLSTGIKEGRSAEKLEKTAKSLQRANEYMTEIRKTAEVIFPPGVHEKSFADLSKMFATTEERRELFQGLKRLAYDLKEAGCETLYLDGSFVTRARFPNDFDACWEPIVGKSKNPLFIAETNTEIAARQSKYLGDIFPRFSDEFGDRVRHWQMDQRYGFKKGVLKIDLRKLP